MGQVNSASEVAEQADAERETSVVDLNEEMKRLQDDVARLESELEEAEQGASRKRLPATRNAVTHKFTVGQHKGYMTVGLFEDGTPGEVFLTMAKEGSTIGGLMDTVGILTSLALQYGVPVEMLAQKFEFVRFEPSGWTGNKRMRHASSIVDYVFRWLGMEFSEAYRQERECETVESEAGPNS